MYSITVDILETETSSTSHNEAEIPRDTPDAEVGYLTVLKTIVVWCF